MTRPRRLQMGLDRLKSWSVLAFVADQSGSGLAAPITRPSLGAGARMWRSANAPDGVFASGRKVLESRLFSRRRRRSAPLSLTPIPAPRRGCAATFLPVFAHHLGRALGRSAAFSAIRVGQSG